MLTKYEAIDIAKNSAAKYRLSWSDHTLHVREGKLNGTECFIVSTLESGLDESNCWLDFEFSTPLNFYISRVDGTFLGYGAANRETVIIHRK